MARPVTAILVAAGRSSRMGTDKLWADLWGRPTWRWSLDTLLAVPAVGRIAVTVPPDAIDRFDRAVPAEARERVLTVGGGAARADSVIAGIWALTRAGHDDDTVVLVHDAARPGLTVELVTAIVEAVGTGESAVVPVVPVADSLKRVRAERVVGPVERAEVAAAQTPQAARLGALRAAIEEAHAWGRPITDDAGALAAAGVPVRVIAGDPLNRKLTEPADLVAMRALLAARATPLVPPGSAAELPSGVRCGIGFDAHRLVDGRPMIVGGVRFADESRGPEGHSDGDAVLHALIDALLGAAQLGDVGTLFPADAAWEGADSAELVRRAVQRLADHGWRPTSADVAVAIDRPAIAPRRAEIAERVASLLGIGADAVAIKGTTSDGLGFTAGGGMAAWAVAGIERSAA
ncbi:MAG TPA: 2-C-methyl-D-erythritol 4-phosphate cytidylyltransferase [Candidatus Limnocylindrales bacterium]|nr:2-C-methyl-D-erythritol 4-phosphate cytidylyltransferase [Candidatus Limnocylindrales bacterium]